MSKKKIDAKKVESYFYDIQVPQFYNTMGEMRDAIVPPFALRLFPSDCGMVEEMINQINESCDKILKLNDEYLGEDIVDEDNSAWAKYNKTHEKEISKYFHPIYFKMCHDQSILLYDRMTTMCRKMVDMIENIITLGPNPYQFNDAKYKEALDALTPQSEIFNGNMIANLCDAGFEIDNMVDNMLSFFYTDINKNVEYFDPDYDNEGEADLVDINATADELIMHDYIRTIIHKYDPSDENSMIQSAKKKMHDEISEVIEAIDVLYYTKTMPSLPTREELNKFIEENYNI